MASTHSRKYDSLSYPYDPDDTDHNDADDDDNEFQSDDEDTDDASETEVVKREGDITEIKEQMYRDKLASLKKQLQELSHGAHPEYIKKLKKLEAHYKERLRLNEIWRDCELDMIEKEFTQEKKAAIKELEQKKDELKENLLSELDEKKRIVETERQTTELTGDSNDIKPMSTRKLRRRPNDPVPLPEKRRKVTPVQLNFQLDDREIDDDLKQLQHSISSSSAGGGSTPGTSSGGSGNGKKGTSSGSGSNTTPMSSSSLSMRKSLGSGSLSASGSRFSLLSSTNYSLSATNPSSFKSSIAMQAAQLASEHSSLLGVRDQRDGPSSEYSNYQSIIEQSADQATTGVSALQTSDARIEDGKLFYDKKWFYRGQSVFIESRDGSKFSGVISAIGSEAIWVRKITDDSKVRIYLSQLLQGKYSVKRRAS